MSLPTPNLDDRHFEDIVEQAKRLIQRYCPEWTDHNISDPGIMLIELFAWMTEMILFRLNRVPDKSYITFMELMGIRLQPPSAARADLTFWLSAPAKEVMIIPAGTEVTTLQTEADIAIRFSTETELQIRPPDLVACLTSPDDQTFEDQTSTMNDGYGSFLAFNPSPRPGNSFYVGSSNDLSRHILAIGLDCDLEGIGINPNYPPITWEAWYGDGWYPTEIEHDNTAGLNQSGQVILHLPHQMAQREYNGIKAYWVRCRLIASVPGQPTYSASPRISKVSLLTLGGTTSVINAATVYQEIVGRSNGTSGQSFQLRHLPILPRSADETIEIQSPDGVWEAWTEVSSFGESRSHDCHFVLDSINGQVSFGPSINEPTGIQRQYGEIPRMGSLIRFKKYRSGGGAIGNISAGKLSVLSSSVPYVDRVTNRRPASGGRNAESLEHAKLRAPQLLRTSSRAVTPEDYEYLARMAAPDAIARAACIHPRALADSGNSPPGVVRVLLVPNLSFPEGPIKADQLNLSADLIQEVQQYLDARRLLTTVVTVGVPTYISISADIRIKTHFRINKDSIIQEGLKRLYRFLNPLVGGTNGGGWPFGRDLYISQIYALLQEIPGIEYIEAIDLVVDKQSTVEGRIIVPSDGVIISGDHHIIVV